MKLYYDVEAVDAEHRARKLAENKVWREEHREELIAEWHEKWATDEEFRAGRQAKSRARQLKKYGLTPADYERMLIEQKRVCAVAAEPA